MATFYADSSVLVKRHVQKVGSAFVFLASIPLEEAHTKAQRHKGFTPHKTWTIEPALLERLALVSTGSTCVG